MKKVYICVWLTAILLLVQHVTRAQGSLGLYTTSVSNNLPAMGEQFSLFTKLINTSPVDTFKGIVDFSLANETGVIDDITVFGEPAVSGTFITLAPLQEMSLLFTITPQPTYFVPGPDIIIVWPLATAPIVDSARAQINIQEPTGIDGAAEETIKMFAHNGYLILQMPSEKEWLQRVQIFDVTGALLISEQLDANNATVPIGMLAKGIYIAEVTSRTGNKRSIKFIR